MLATFWPSVYQLMLDVVAEKNMIVQSGATLFIDGDVTLVVFGDLIVEDDSRVGTVRFTMSEDNVRKKLALPWMSFCSDSSSQAPEPPFTHSQPHPRGYGAFARLLGKYARDEGIITLQEAIHRLTQFPAGNLKLKDRGTLAPGHFADIAVFDPARIRDHATFEQPHQLATGMVHVFVNGEQVLSGGMHTGAKPGRFVRGPGYVP